MKAIILAAGVGSRLRPITDDKPKTLVEVNGKPMLGYIIEALASNGVRQIVVCTGYRGEKIRDYCERQFPDVAFSFVHNIDFESTNNMYSLYLARHEFTEDVLLMNADLVFGPGVIRRMVAATGSAVAVDVGVYNDESMKVTVRPDGTIDSIRKTTSAADSFGSSIDVYRLAQPALRAVVDEMTEIIEVKQDRNRWTEVMLDNLFRDRRVEAMVCDIRPERWFEIDNYNDLATAEVLFNEILSSLPDKKVYFLDRDGTLMTKDAPIPGAVELLERLQAQGKSVFVLTNNSSKTAHTHLKTLQGAGLPVAESNVLVSTDAFVHFCALNGIQRVYWLANEQTSEYLAERGLTWDAVHPQALLLTYDDELTYHSLCEFVRSVRRGIPYYATHIDLVCPEPDGFIPDIGCYARMIEEATGRKPLRTFGKPSMDLVRPTLERMGLSESDAVIIGDRLYTDIAMASGTDMTSVLVLSGETNRGAYENASTRADIVVPSVRELLRFVD